MTDINFMVAYFLFTAISWSLIAYFTQADQRKRNNLNLANDQNRLNTDDQ